MIQQCRKILHEMKNDENEGIIEEGYLTCYKLEIACLSYLKSPVLEDRVMEILTIPPKPFTFYLDLYYLLDQLNVSLPRAKKECLRTALNYQLQTTLSMDRVLETIHGLVDVSESKQDSFHWIEQLLQITKSQGPDFKPSKESSCYMMVMIRQMDEYAYFTSITWNHGIYYQRLNNPKDAEQFLSLAIQLLPYCGDLLKV